MQNETLVYHLEDKHTPTRKRKVNGLNTRRDQKPMSKSTVQLFKSVIGVKTEKICVLGSHLNDHFKGEYSGEDIIKITKDLGN